MTSIQTKIMNALKQCFDTGPISKMSSWWKLMFLYIFFIFPPNSSFLSAHVTPSDPALCSLPHHGTYRISTLMLTAFIQWTQHAQGMSKPAYFTSEIKLNLTTGLTSRCPRCSTQIWPANSLQVAVLSRTPHLCFCYSFGPVALTWLLIVLLLFGLPHLALVESQHEVRLCSL